MRKRITILLAVTSLLMLTANVFAQSRYQVKTVVTDLSGESVIGATVLEKGTDNGVATDLDGNALLLVSSSDAIVEISCIGYSTQSFIASEIPARIVLQEDTEFIDDVVVIGYGSVKKNDLTGAVTALKPDSKNKVKATQATDLILGKVSGLQIIQGSGSIGSEATVISYVAEAS